jgi:hypothetical protein
MATKRLPRFLSTRYQRDRLRRRAVALAAVAVAGWLVVNLTEQGRSRSHKPTANPGCACAGYTWFGHVSSVSATWTVPRMGANALGTASDWIGAQSGGIGSPFIQIGVTEQRYVSKGFSNLHLPRSAYQVSYTAFWSDTAHGYHPVYVGGVLPGDAVHASLRLVDGKWRMHLVDRHTLLDVNRRTSQEAQAPLHLAEWAQEDVAYGKVRLFPYPRLSAFTFGELKVDGHDPGAKELFSNSMPVRSRVILVPSRVAADQFTIGPARARRPTGRAS